MKNERSPDDMSSDVYSEGPRSLQEKHGTIQLADGLASRFHSSLGIDDVAFIENVNFFFLATAGLNGQPQCSYKGGSTGFVDVVSENRLRFPSYDGNGMFLTAGNISENSRVGMLFIDFDKQTRLRVEGRATVVEVEPMDQITFDIEVEVDRVFSNCERYIHTLEQKAVSVFIPEKGKEMIQPAWKKRPWLAKLLPK